ncbi:MAG: DUF2332 domain-containing protein [Actinomycetota bacterium]
MTEPATSSGDDRSRLADRYRRFARVETDGISPRYTELAMAVADDEPTLEFLAGLPAAKQQPNLLFAAWRAALADGAPPGDAGEFLTRLHRDPDPVRAVMLARSNQMNEPARCGVLVPLLSRIEAEEDRPLSLVEIGASAGLCLHPDRYRYRWQWTDGTEQRVGDGDPEIALTVDGPAPLPERPVTVAWRGGLDLNPLELTDPADRTWLHTLIWPEHTHRAERLAAAIETVTAIDPGERGKVVRADLRTGLADLVAEAPSDTTVVVYHSAVLAYLPSRSEIDAVADQIGALGVRWIANEAPGVFPDATGPWRETIGRDFALLLDGVPVAAAGPHGQSLRWFERRPR